MPKVEGKCSVCGAPLELTDDRDKPRVRSFEDLGVLTSNTGLVLRAPDGQEFQITVVRSR